MTTNQKKLMATLHTAPRAWQKVADLAEGLGLTAHAAGCALKGLYSQGLVDFQPRKVPGKGTFRYYKLTRTGTIEAKRQRKLKTKGKDKRPGRFSFGIDIGIDNV